MSFGEALILIGFGATIFALILGVFSVWNGRMIKKENHKSNRPIAGSNNKSNI